jgi:signal transduction histidine kinase
MKGNVVILSRSYAKALRQHLLPGSRNGLKRAFKLGRQAAGLRLEILQFAKIHEQALVPLLLAASTSGTRSGVISRAQTFFMEAITPIEWTHLRARAARLQLKELKNTLMERTAELSLLRSGIKERVAARKNLELTRKAKESSYSRLLEESHLMQKELRYLAHQVLSAQEAERGKISRELHDEIAQAILPIHSRLLMLNQKSTGDLEGLLKEISKAQTLVEQSVRKTRQFVKRFSLRHAK